MPSSVLEPATVEIGMGGFALVAACWHRRRQPARNDPCSAVSNADRYTYETADEPIVGIVFDVDYTPGGLSHIATMDEFMSEPELPARSS